MKPRSGALVVLAFGLGGGFFACTGTDPATGAGTTGGVTYTADTRVLESFPVQLRTTVRALNSSREGARLELSSGCAVQLAAYRDAQRTQLSWDQSRIQMCTMALQIIDIAPGAARNFEGSTDARAILGDSLPDGTYFLTAVMHVNGRKIEIPAGSATLGVPR